ncbi:MAG: cell wall hydrolase [Lachnospiraceae bacterium]|nr:cell wall hydrolase [Lachnospiraceae bacterium]
MRNSVKRLFGILKCVNPHTHLWCMSVLGGAILLCVSFFVEPSQREFLTVSSEGAQTIAIHKVIEYSSVLGSLSHLGDEEVDEIAEAIPDVEIEDVSSVIEDNAKVPEIFVYHEEIQDSIQTPLSPGAIFKGNVMMEAQYSLDEVDALERLVQCEAATEDATGKRLVADVVLNRLDTGIWGSDMLSVIESPGQFKPVSSGAYRNVFVEDDTKDAVMDALLNDDISNGAIYFQKSCATVWGDKEFLFRYGSHSFYK